MADRDVKPGNVPALEAEPIAGDPSLYRIRAPRGWRFRGEQVDPHEVLYRDQYSQSVISLVDPPAARWLGKSEANDAATELRRHLEPCDCRSCDGATD